MAVNPDFRDLFVAFNAAWYPRNESKYGQTPIHVISCEGLILNKRALGRPKDLDDLQALGGE